MAETMAKNSMAPPRPDESFVDKMIFHAGGRRLTADERANDEAENADYVIEEFIVEGKDLQEERLAKPECHERIAEIFWPYFEEAAVVPLDPAVLSDNDFQRYVEILARPIESAVKKASRQVRATIDRMQILGWERGIVLLNSGYGSLSHDLFEQIAAREAKERSFKLLVCLTARTQTNGFDTYMTWEISPKNPSTHVESKLFHSFDKIVTEVMDDWGHGGFLPSLQTSTACGAGFLRVRPQDLRMGSRFGTLLVCADCRGDEAVVIEKFEPASLEEAVRICVVQSTSILRSFGFRFRIESFKRLYCLLNTTFWKSKVIQRMTSSTKFGFKRSIKRFVSGRI